MGSRRYCLGGLGDATDPGSGAHALIVRLEGLESLVRQALQGCGVCHGLESSAKHQEP